MSGSTGRRRGLALMFVDPKSAATEDEFNRWFDGIHLAEVLAVPGIASATRYRRIPLPRPSPIGQHYLTLLEIEADDIEDVARRLREAGPAMVQTDSIATDPPPVVCGSRSRPRRNSPMMAARMARTISGCAEL